jgi:hypothetical protein
MHLLGVRLGSLASSSFILLTRSSPLPVANSLLSRCSIAVFEIVVVVVVTCRMSTAGSAGCNGGIVSVSCSSSEARNFAIAFRTPSGNGPDQVSAQFCSMRASCVSIFSTVFMFSSVSANVAGFVYV